MSQILNYYITVDDFYQSTYRYNSISNEKKVGVRYLITMRTRRRQIIENNFYLDDLLNLW